MGFFFKTCEKCKRSLDNNAFFTTKSPFHPDGTLNLCRDCVSNLLRDHPNDLRFADQLCQWADIPFEPNEWIKLYETNKENTFNVYHSLYCEDERADVNWTKYNEIWVEAQNRGTLEDKIDFFSAEKMKQLRKKWGPNYDEEEINYLEQLLVGMTQTQNISTPLQMDQAFKLCKISLIIDEKIRADEEFKDLLGNYDKLVKIADFTPKNAKNANDFDSAGEIYAYLEKTGWINKYYDGVDRDIVDKTMKNIQAWLRHIYVNETGIADDIQNRIEALKAAKQLETQDDMASEDELESMESEAYLIEEDFNPEA